jgi:hypothetical protein
MPGDTACSPAEFVALAAGEEYVRLDKAEEMSAATPAGDGW